MKSKVWIAIAIVMIVAAGAVAYIAMGNNGAAGSAALQELRDRKRPFEVAVVGGALPGEAQSLPVEFQRADTNGLLSGEVVGVNVIWFVGEEGASYVLGDEVLAGMLRQLVSGGQPLAFVNLPSAEVASQLRTMFRPDGEAAGFQTELQGDLYAIFFASAEKDGGYVVQVGDMVVSSEATDGERLERALLTSYELALR